MSYRTLLCGVALCAFPIAIALSSEPARQPAIPNMTVPPKAGPVAFFPESALRPGMKGVAWTVFQGSTVEPVPVEIIGVWQNMWGPHQDVILAKLAGKALRTNVAGGMSGSPVYIDGKLAGAIALRLSTFSPDAVCGITPIQLMLEIKD
ncbi:MAG: SpoIVB peptidase S55, partial [Acidobacteriaceae bacterium]|nr:SpoIVB peptidase S55 [Acidobacteriaceae bacterium]